MKRYKQANEGIHAPEEVKKRAARPGGKRSYAPWMGAVAAVLAVVIAIGAAARPGGGPDPRSSSHPGSRSGPAVAAKATALSAAVYPEMAPYPRDEDFFSGYDSYSDAAFERYSQARQAWQEDMDALHSGTDYAGMLDGFLTGSTAQFLTGAGKDNRVYSPLNVYMALSMLAETTGGDSRRQILDLLQADSIETLRERASALWRDNYRDDGTVTSILGSSLWLRDDFTYSQETLDTLAKDYYASSFSGKMGTEEYDQALRGWLNGQTRGLLEEQAGELKMLPDTVLALASTIYFKAAWSGEFDKGSTQPEVFHAPSGDVETDFMKKSIWSGYYYWGEHFGAVSLHFQNGGSMWFILPDEGYSVDQLLKSGEAMEFLLADKSLNRDDPAAWQDWKHLDINLSMPRFDVSSKLDLIDGLKKLGVTDVFDLNVSNFDPLGASTDDPLYVNKAEHAARVKVDEEGCEAAAYTVLMVPGGAAAPPDEEMDFILDRPFLFAVTGDSGLPLFTGVVNQPSGAP